MNPKEIVTLEDMKKYIRYITKQKRPDISDTDTERMIEVITQTVKLHPELRHSWRDS